MCNPQEACLIALRYAPAASLFIASQLAALANGLPTVVDVANNQAANRRRRERLAHDLMDYRLKLE